MPRSPNPKYSEMQPWLDYRCASECAYFVLQKIVSGSIEITILTIGLHGYALLLYQRRIEANAMLVTQQINKMAIKEHLVSELSSEGIIILARTVERFDIDKGNRFSSYACPYIVRGIRRFERDHPAISIPRSDYELATKAYRVENKLIARNGYTSPEEVANACGKRVTVERIQEAKESYKGSTPCAMPRDEDTGEEIEFPDTSDQVIADEETLKKMAIAAATQYEKQVREAAYLLQKTPLPADQKQWAFEYFFSGKDERAIARAHKASPNEVSKCIESVLFYFENHANNHAHCSSGSAITRIRLERPARTKAISCA